VTVSFVAAFTVVKWWVCLSFAAVCLFWHPFHCSQSQSKQLESSISAPDNACDSNPYSHSGS